MAYDEKKNEDEWFALHERDLIRQLRRERVRKEQQIAEDLKEQEAKKSKDLHWMKCPKCGSDLHTENIEGIDVDKCERCEGIFLDRGELEEFLLKEHHHRRNFMRRITGLFK